MTTRREFLITSAAFAAASALPSVLRAEPHVKRIARPGLQLYTLNAEMRNDPAAIIAQVAAIGYKEVEFAYYFGNTPERLRELIDANGLVAPSAHCAMNDLEQRFSDSVHAAKVLGHDTLVIPGIDRAKLTSIADWKAMARRFDELGKRLQDVGIRLGHHNHDFEFAPVEGTRGYDVLVGETDPALVDFELDLYWITKGGGDPVDYFTRFPGRFPIVHIKDTDGPPAFRMLDPGAGIIDFKRIFAAWKQAGIKHFYAEVDKPENPTATMKASLQYLKAIELP